MVPSLLDAMADGSEFGSIVGLTPPTDLDITSEFRRALSEIEKIRNRPCLCYLANVVKQDALAGIDFSDDLPFREMVSLVDQAVADIDVLIVTPGGIIEQVSHFVDTLRPRFGAVNYILPERSMSAGALWVLSGDHIWMDSRAYIGPIDPQVAAKDGQYVSVQSIQILLKHVQDEGQKAIESGKSPDWTLIRMIDNLDLRVVGAAITQSNYSKSIAQDFLMKYKFRNWNVRLTSGEPVTDSYKEQRSREIAELLCSNEHWKSHGHGITRDVADSKVRLAIHHLETVEGLERAVRRFWALVYFAFDRLPVSKLFLSQQYSVYRIKVGASS